MSYKYDVVNVHFFLSRVYKMSMHLRCKIIKYKIEILVRWNVLKKKKKKVRNQNEKIENYNKSGAKKKKKKK